MYAIFFFQSCHSGNALQDGKRTYLIMTINIVVKECDIIDYTVFY